MVYGMPDSTATERKGARDASHTVSQQIINSVQKDSLLRPLAGGGAGGAGGLGLSGGGYGDSDVFDYLNEIGQYIWQGFDNFIDALARHVFGEKFIIGATGTPEGGTESVTAEIGDLVTDTNKFLVIHDEKYVYRDPIATAAGESDNTESRSVAEWILEPVANWLKDDDGVIGAFYEGIADDDSDSDGTTDSVKDDSAINTAAYWAGKWIHDLFTEDVVTHMTNAVALVQEFTFDASNAIENFGETLGTALGNSWTWLNETLGSIGQGVVNSLISAWNTPSEFIDQLGTDLTNAINNATVAIIDWFKDDTGIFGGFYHGLYNDDDDSDGDDQNTTISGLYGTGYYAGKWIRDVFTASFADTWTQVTSLLSQFSFDAANALEDFGTTVGNALGAAWTWLSGLGASVQTAIETAATWVGEAAARIQSTLSGWGRDIWTGLTNFGNAIRNTLDGLGEAVWEGFTNFGNAVKDTLGAAWDWLEDLTSSTRTAITTAANYLTSTVRSSINAARTWVASAASNIQSTLNGFAESVWEGFNNFGGAVEDVLGAAWDWLKDLTDSTRTAITTAANYLTSTVRSSINAARTWVASAASNIESTVRNFAEATWEGFTNFGSAVGDVLGSAWTRAQSIVSSAFTFTGNTVSGIATNMRTYIQNWLTGLGQTVWDNFTGLANYINSIAATIQGVAKSFADRIDNAWNNLTVTTSSTANTIWDAITGVLPFAYADSDRESGDSRPVTNGSQSGHHNLDLRTWDITRVDRIFFDSNDSIYWQSDKPQISGSGNSMYLGIPYNEALLAGIRRTSSGTSAKLAIEGYRDYTIVRDLRIATDGLDTDTSANGSFLLDGNDVKVRTGNSLKNLSDIGSGDGGTPTPPTQSTVRVRLFVTSNTANLTANNLRNNFGTEKGAFGIAGTNIGNDNNGRAWICIQGNSNYFRFGSVSSWLRGTYASSTSTGGSRARMTYLEGTSENPSDTAVADAAGSIFVYQETDDQDDGLFGVAETASAGRGIALSSLVDRASTSSTGTSLSLIDELPTINTSSVSPSSLDTAFGSAEGNMGYNISDNHIYGKVRGWWFRWNLSSGWT